MIKNRRLNPFISEIAIFIYIGLYLIIFISIDFNLLLENVIYALFKFSFGSYLLLYFGLKFIQKREARLIGGTLFGVKAIIAGIIFLLLSIIWLII